MTGVRLDKWLWAARFFKTRGLSSEEIGRGRISVNGQPVNGLVVTFGVDFGAAPPAGCP